MSDTDVRVQLVHASLPWPLGTLAVHYWLNVWHALGRCDRWEVWQRADSGGWSCGHLHRNLKAPMAGVGGGAPVVEREWTGDEAARIRAVLEHAQYRYPHCRRYLPWPGPNSNTFVAWVLREAGVHCPLSWKAVGCRYGWK